MGGDLSTRAHAPRSFASGPVARPGRQASFQTNFDCSSGWPNRARNLARSLARLHRGGGRLYKRWLLVTGAAGGLAFTIDFDGAFEVRSIFDHDAGRCQVAD